MITIKVSDLVGRVNEFLHRAVNLNQAMISGELSNVRYVNGHCYFDLKDDKGQLSCTMWKSYASRAGFILEDGMAVLVHGTLNIYERRGSLQLSVDAIEQAGLGALFLELEKRRKLLAAQGYFDAAHKKPKPSEIRKIGIVTGESTAALQDALKTIRHRWPMMEVHLFPAPVQGLDAPPKIVRALKKADQAGLDAVLLVRGGGSFEDLFCFNDPEIVKTLYHMHTFTVTGIGHEIDTSLADLAADQRGLTPTWAAAFVSPDQQEVMARLQMFQRQMTDTVRSLLNRNIQRMIFIQSNTPLADPLAWLQTRKDRQSLLSTRLVQIAARRMSVIETRLDALNAQLSGNLEQLLAADQRILQARTSALLLHSPSTAIAVARRQLQDEQNQMLTALSHSLERQKLQLETLENSLSALSPQGILERGYSIVSFQGKTITDGSSLCAGDTVSIQFSHGQAAAGIKEVIAKDSIRSGHTPK